jgi:hypothetical protein
MVLEHDEGRGKFASRVCPASSISRPEFNRD